MNGYGELGLKEYVVGHSEIPVLGGYRSEKVKHRNVSFDGDDINSTLSNTVGVFVSLGCEFKSIVERVRGRCG